MDQISMRDKTILVTGATDGIGKQTALELARMEARVIIHGRNSQRVQNTINEIKIDSGNDNLEASIADFSSLQQVKIMADKIRSEFDHLDVLINNAGILPMHRILTMDGFELNLQVNHLAPLLLTTLLLDLIIKSTHARIVNVSSDAHSMCELDFENLLAEKNFNWLNAYGLSKLGIMYMTYEFAEQLQEFNITVNCLHPGDVDTKMQRLSSTEKGVSLSLGAATSIFLSSSPEIANVTGKYFIDMKVTPSCDLSYDIEKRSRFMDISRRMIAKFLD